VDDEDAPPLGVERSLGTLHEHGVKYVLVGYMAAMADVGDGPYRARDVVKRLGSSSGTSVHRDSLIKKGLIFSPDFGLIDFTVPQFVPFMRRRYPFKPRVVS